MLLKKSLRQTLLGGIDQQNINSQFQTDMCHAFVAANIKWHKLKYPTFIEFLKKYCGHKIPEESTLQKNYLPKCYNDVSQN